MVKIFERRNTLLSTARVPEKPLGAAFWIAPLAERATLVVAEAGPPVRCVPNKLRGNGAALDTDFAAPAMRVPALRPGCAPWIQRYHQA